MKFLDNMTTRQRKLTAVNCVVVESFVAATQVVLAMVSGSAASWFVAMFAVVMGAVAWVVFTPTPEA